MNGTVTSWVADFIPDAIAGIVNIVLSIKPIEELETFQEFRHRLQHPARG